MKPPRRPRPGAEDERPKKAVAGDDALDHGLRDLLDEDRRHEAIAERRQGELRRAMERDTATFDGVLRDLAEQAVTVTVEQPGGQVTGRIVTLAPDHLVVATHTGTVAVLARWAVTAVTPDDGTIVPDSVGRRTSSTALDLRDVLAELAESAPEVVLHLVGRSSPVVGILRAVGEDMVTIAARPDSGTRTGPTVIALHNVVRVLIGR